MKKTFLLSCLMLAAMPVMAAYTGHVYVDKNKNGVFDQSEKPLAGIKVSDGLNVVETAADGSFTLPGHERERFIFITTPSGYKTFNRHYHKIEKKQSGYDFGLIPYSGRIRKNGSHRYIHIADTEIFNTENHEDWVNNVRDYALKAHIKLMNTENMDCPVFYCIGNHDLVKGKYGEELFESIYGPVYYSFDAGNVHYVVTPMPGGDHAPGYTSDDVCRWLKNDLAHIRPGTPVVVFNHDLLTYEDTFIFKSKNAGSINLNEYNLKAWVYGHWHINYMKKQGDVYELRYTYLDKNICIASPAGVMASGVLPVAVNVYSSVSPVREVLYTCLADGKPVLKNKRLLQSTDWSWNGELPLSHKYVGKELTLRVTARFNNGEIAEAESNFICRTEKAVPLFSADWDNLSGNAKHSAPVSAPLNLPLQLAWTNNVGANLYMTSPLIHKGKVIVASVDEDLKGAGHVYALNGKDGTILWSCPVRNSIKNSIAVDSDIVFAQDAQGFLYAIDTETGKLCWEKQLPVNGLPALIDGLVAGEGVVYAGTGKGLCAFEARTGKQLWKNEGWGQGEGTTSTLTLGNNLLVAGAQWNALYGNDAKTGEKLWAVSDNGLRNRGASPAMHGALLYLISDKSFFILEAATGKVIVRKPLPYNVDVTSTPLLTDKEIIFGSAQKGLIALDSETLEEKWTCPVGDALVYTCPYSRQPSATIETSAVWAGDIVYVAASDGTVYGINKEDGKVVWKHATGAPMFGSVALSGNALVVSDFGGNVYLFCK